MYLKYGGKSSVTIKQKKEKMPFKDSRCGARKPLGRLLIYVVVKNFISGCFGVSFVIGYGIVY